MDCGGGTSDEDRRRCRWMGGTSTGTVESALQPTDEREAEARASRRLARRRARWALGRPRGGAAPRAGGPGAWGLCELSRVSYEQQFSDSRLALAIRFTQQNSRTNQWDVSLACVLR